VLFVVFFIRDEPLVKKLQGIGKNFFSRYFVLADRQVRSKNPEKELKMIKNMLSRKL
jgi:hypothetical protein